MPTPPRTHVVSVGRRCCPDNPKTLTAAQRKVRQVLAKSTTDRVMARAVGQTPHSHAQAS